MKYIVGILTLLLGVAVGLAVPDIDLKMSFLTHRSALTHSALLPLLLLWPTRRWWRPALRPFTIGICVALAVHFCFDFFSRLWLGYALIHIPVIGRLGAVTSRLWLALNAIICLYLAFLLADEISEMAFTVAGALLAYRQCAVRSLHDIQALVALLVATAIALLLPAHPIQTVLSILAGRARYRTLLSSRGGEK